MNSNTPIHRRTIIKSLHDFIHAAQVIQVNAFIANGVKTNFFGDGQRSRTSCNSLNHACSFLSKLPYHSPLMRMPVAMLFMMLSVHGVESWASPAIFMTSTSAYRIPRCIRPAMPDLSRAFSINRTFARCFSASSSTRSFLPLAQYPRSPDRGF